MSAITFAKGGGGKASSTKGGGVVGAIVSAIAGDGGCGNGTVNGKKGFQPGNKCSGKDNRNQQVAAARSAHTAAARTAKGHITKARKAGTALSSEGRAAVKSAAAAHRELQAARATHQAGKREARNTKARETRAAAKTDETKKATAQQARFERFDKTYEANVQAKAKREAKAAQAKATEPRAEAKAALKAAQVTPKPAPVVSADKLSTKDFADRVVKAAQASPTGGFGNEKTLISHVKAQLEKTDPAFKGMSDAAFKAKLVEANVAGHLDLGRGDRTQMLNPGDVKASSTPHMNVDYHFVRHPEKATAPPPKATIADRVKGSAKEASDIKTKRATDGIGSAKDPAAIDRVARGASKDELFAAAKAAGIEHQAKTKGALVEHLKGHVAGQGKTAPPPVTPAAPSTPSTLTGPHAEHIDKLMAAAGVKTHEELAARLRDLASTMPKGATGIKPPKPAKAPPGPKAEPRPVAPVSEAAKTRVSDLRKSQEDWHNTSLAAQDAKIAELAKLPAPQLKEVQREFLGTTIGKTKAEQVYAIRRKLDSFASTKDRVEGILAR